jgi:hypothetical protein
MPILRDALELYLEPASAALLPWPWAFRWLRLLARHARPYAEQTEAAEQCARSHGEAGTGPEWRWRHRLVRLVDHADLYLSLTRRDTWLDRNIEVSGAWPSRGPFLAVTFHWGTGFWSLRHLRRSGFRPAMLSTPVTLTPAALDLRARYARLRNREVARASGEPVIYLGGAKSRIRAHLAQGGVLVGLLDVPASQTPQVLPVRMLGRDSAFPRGIFDLAQESQLPIVPFLFGLDPVSGRRQLQIHGPLSGSGPQAWAEAAADAFTRALENDSPAWHRWPDAPLFFPAGAAQKR